MSAQKSLRFILFIFTITIVVISVIVVISSSNLVMAQSTGPDGPVDNSPVNTSLSTSQGDGLTVVDVPIVPLSNTGDGFPETNDFGTTGFQAEDPLAFDNIMATLSYYRLVGTAFNERTSATTFAYNFNGCVYETGGIDNRFMAPLLLPEDAVIKFLRLYYNDTNPSSDITAWITRYQPGVSSEDLTNVTSMGSSGYGTTLSAEITHTVDLASWAYTVVIAPNANSSSNAFCGVRVAYYAPRFGALVLPVVTKNTR